MKTQGSLTERDLATLVQDLFERAWTGVLILSSGGVGRTVTVQDGRMVFASSSSPDDRLGELLLRRGRLTLRQFADASASVGPGRRLGAVLVEQGVLGPKDLVTAVVEHTQEIIYGAFQWTEGQYRLQPGPPPPEAITLKISTPDLIVEGIRRIDSWSRIQRAVGVLTTRYARAQPADEALRTMRIDPQRAAILRGLDEPQTVEAICAGTELPDVDVCRTLWAFRVIGAVRRLDAAPQAAALADDGLGLVLPE
ncbi:MAG TPA: DUF4388 domain-containing protein [Vicinamibacteria bacterium]|nr:DUF4388 domain-containing protein [Vicinamibacteria bacterium]